MEKTHKNFVLEILQKHFKNISIHKEEALISYEASQADMEKFYHLTGWKNFRPLEETLPDLIAFEKLQIK